MHVRMHDLWLVEILKSLAAINFLAPFCCDKYVVQDKLMTAWYILLEWIYRKEQILIINSLQIRNTVVIHFFSSLSRRTPWFKHVGN